MRRDRHGQVITMVNASRVMDEDRNILRWGGLAGLVGGLLLILVFVIVGVFIGAEPTTLEGPIARFPDIRVVRMVENGLYLAVLVLWALLSLALYRHLSRTSPAPALFGSVLSVLGLGVLAAGALPHVATGPLSDLYHAPSVTSDEKAALASAWQATQGIFDALVVVGLLLIPTAVILLGSAIHRDPGFGTGIGRTSMALGVAGLAAGTITLIDPASPVAAFGFFALIIFHLIVGWKTYRLSRAGRERSER
jgi:hypothetical protein